MARTKAMYPAPVYHATLDDGRTVRMTVWQAKDAPTKGFDWEICRRTVLHTSDWSQPSVPTYCAGVMLNMPPMLTETGRKIISAHLEQSGDVLADDPLCEVKPVKKRANNGAIMAALRAFLEGKPEARQLAEMALA